MSYQDVTDRDVVIGCHLGHIKSPGWVREWVLAIIRTEFKCDSSDDLVNLQIK